MHAGVGRRTAVRGAAWTVPVIAVAAAAPAYAVSAGLTLSGFTAAYLNTDNVATVDPTKLVVNATIGNTGPQTTTGLKFTLTIPAGLYHSAPTVATTPAGWNAPTISPATGTGPWVLEFTAPAGNPPAGGQIASSGTKPFSTTISFTDPTNATPFRRWAGSAFILAGSATATNAVTQSASASVARTVNSPISWGTGNEFDASAFFGYRARVRINDLWNGGGSTIGRFRIRVDMAKPTSGISIFANGAQAQPADLDPKWTFIESNAETQPNGPWYWIFETTAAAFSPSAGRGGSDTTDGPPPGPSFEAYLVPRNRGIVDVNVTLPSTRTFTVTADHATQRVMTF